MELAERPRPIPKESLTFPREVELIISAMEAGGGGGVAKRDQRSVARVSYRTRAFLRLFSDVPGSKPWTLYTRDVNRRGMGFVTPHRLPLGYGGVLEVMLPDGQWQHVNCTLLRCREAAPGWFEGSIYFNRDQADFDGLE